MQAAAVLVHRDAPSDAAGARIDARVVLTGGDPHAVRERAAGIPSSTCSPSRSPRWTHSRSPPTASSARRSSAPSVLRAREKWRTRPGGQHRRRPHHQPDRHLERDTGRAVGRDDDFFELGGNTLFAVRIGAALRSRGLPSLRLRELYRHPTIRGTVESLTSPPL
ncbi:phosphopantetheine-binding protein [Streptomyces sp. NPDC002324]